MVYLLSIIVVLLAVGINVASGDTDAGTCPLSGCMSSRSLAASAPALMQHVQPQHPDRSLASIIVSEEPIITSDLPADVQPASRLSEPFVQPLADATAGFASSAQAAEVGAAHGKKEATAAQAAAQHKEAMKSARSVPSVKTEAVSMLQTSQHRGVARLLSKSAPRQHMRLRGWTAPLDEGGYAAVAALKSDDDMEIFVRRVIDAYDCKITNQGAFMGIVPWFSGTTAVQTFPKLQESLLYAVLSAGTPWLAYKNTDGTSGATAELSFVGYVEVAAMRNETEMIKFARRLCEKMGVEIVKESGFMGMLRYYGGTTDFQDFGKLESEIESAANTPNSWGKWKEAQRKRM